MKKKIFVISLAVCLLALSIAGTSMAYFTDVEEATNTFTAGNVDISLTYTTETADDEANPSTPINITNTKLYPGDVYKVDAAISNIGTENAYVGAIITLTNATNTLSEIITLDVKDAGAIPSELKDLFTKLEKDGYSVQYKTVTNGYEIYVIKTAALAAKNGVTVDSAVIFESLVIPTTWDNAQMQVFKDTKLTIKAYATQTKGFENDPAKALKTAFKDDWTGCTIDTTPTTPNP